MRQESIILYEKVIFFCFITFEIISIYGFGDKSFYFFISLIIGLTAIIVCFNNSKRVPKLPTCLVLLCIDATIVELCTSGRVIPFESIQIGIICFSVWCFIKENNIDSYLNMYKKIGMIVVVFFYVQYIFRFSGIFISGIIPFLPICNSYNWVDYLDSETVSSFFSEPSYLNRFIMPLVVLELFSDRKINYAKLLFLVSPIILTISGTAIIALLLLLAYWYISRMGYNGAASYKNIILMTFALLISLYLVLNSSFGSDILGRTSELSMNYEEGTHKSGYIRMWMGFDIFNDYSDIEKVFGTQEPNAREIHLSNTIFGSITDESLTVYTGSGWSSVLMRQGYIGFLFMVGILMEVWRNSSKTGRAILITFLSYMFTESMYTGSRFALYVIIAVCLTKDTAKRLNLR